MMNDEFHAHMRKLMKEQYDTSNGREKSILKYYKRKFKDDDYALRIIMNKSTPVKERLITIKRYNLEKKLSDC